MNGEGSSHRICAFSFRVENLSSDSDLFSLAQDNQENLEHAFETAAARRLPREYELREFRIRKGSVVITACVIGVGFLVHYKDLREAVEQLFEDLKTVLEEFFGSRRQKVFIYSALKWSIVPPPRRHHIMAKILPITVILIAAAAAVVAAVAPGEEKRATETAKPAITTNEVLIGEKTIVVRCAHCVGSGTCHAEINERSCTICKKTFGVKETGAMVPCSVCNGRGYNVPAVEISKANEWKSPFKWIFIAAALLLICWVVEAVDRLRR
jgi:hypothetical protein